MRIWMIVMLIVVVSCLVAMIAELAFGAPPDMSDPIARAALSPDTSIKICTCVEGPLADEIEKLRTQVRLLKAEARVNKGIECAKQRRASQVKR